MPLAFRILMGSVHAALAYLVHGELSKKAPATGIVRRGILSQRHSQIEAEESLAFYAWCKRSLAQSQIAC